MLMEAIAVVIMAKAPRAGEVKTRLCPPLSRADASELYRRFLLDKIDQVRALRTASPAIAYTPAEARAFAKGLRVACLPAWYDIDTSDDLARLRMALAASDGDSPRHTRAFFLERQG